MAQDPGSFAFEGEVWEHDGPGAWHFVSLPEPVADEIDDRWGRQAGGFGSVKVEVTIGTTRWSTSLFPDSRRGTYVLPVKKAVRTAENLADGSVTTVELVVRPIDGPDRRPRATDPATDPANPHPEQLTADS